MGMSADQADPEAQNKRFTVLVVEDEPTVRLIASDILRDAGYVVVETSTATDALILLASDQEVHLVFSDVLMPGSIGGLTLAGWIKANRPTIPVILSSGISAVRRYLQGRAGVAFLEKPYGADDLLNLVSRLLVGPESDPKDRGRSV